MKVWIVEGGMYSDRGIEGVYASFEAVQRAYPKEKWANYEASGWYFVQEGFPGEFDPDSLYPLPDSYHNNKDLDRHLSAHEYEVVD